MRAKRHLEGMESNEGGIYGHQDSPSITVAMLRSFTLQERDGILGVDKGKQFRILLSDLQRECTQPKRDGSCVHHMQARIVSIWHLTVFHSWKGTAVKRMLGVQTGSEESRGKAVKNSGQYGVGGSK